MKFLRAIFLCICIVCPLWLIGQDVSLEITSTPSTCFANGTITITLKGNDVPLLSQIVYTVTNTTTQDSRFGVDPVFENLSKGNYSVTVDAFYKNAAIQKTGSATIAGNYVAPTAYKVGDARLLGTRKTFNCRNTGRVVLEITGGVFPYFVDTYLNSSIIKRDTFYTYQNSGNNINLPDYKDFYNIENLPAGTFTFKIKDGCSYGLPDISETVGKVGADYPCNIISIEPTNKISDYNIVNIDFDNIYDYISDDSEVYKYYYDQKYRNIAWWEYTYSFDGGAEKVRKNIPPAWDVNDTVTSAEKYCELWNKNYQIKVGVKGCSVNACNTTIKVGCSGSAFVNSHNIFDSISGCVDKEKMRISVRFSTYKEFITAPLHCKIIEIPSGDVWAELDVNSRMWYWEELVNTSKVGVNLRVIVVDKNNCPLVDQISTIQPPPENSWDDFNRDRICNYANEFDIINVSWNECINSYGKPPHNTKIELVESPNENYFHFIATYNRNLNNWNFSNYNSNAFTLSTYDNCNVNMYSKDLVSGHYLWKITDDCGRDDLMERDYEFYKYELEAPFTFNTQITCDGKVYYPKVKLVAKRKNDGYTITVPVHFNVTGVAGGFYPASGTCNTDYVTLTKPGDYQMSFNLFGTDISCFISPQIMTFSYDGLAIEKAYGYACDDGVHKVSKVVVTVDSTTGMAPYHFVLQNGALIVSNNTGVFYDVGAPNDNVLVTISEQCGATYLQGVKIENLQSGARVAFAANNHVCLGNPIQLYSISIAGATMRYEWKGPNGFSSFSKDTVINNATLNDAGDYFLHIIGLECDIIDTVSITIALPDTGYIEDYVCRGARYREHGFDIPPLDIPDSTYIFYRSDLTTQEYQCDSVLCLMLFVRDYAAFTIDPVNEICADDPYFILPCNFYDELMNFYYIRFNEKALEQGFQDIDSGRIIHNDYIEIPIPQGIGKQDYVLPHHNYAASIYVDNGKCNSPTLEFPFQISYPSWIIEQKWNDVIALLNDRYNGGFFFSEYAWYKNGKRLEGEHGPYIYILPNLEFGAEYRALITRTTDNEAIFTCPLIPEHRPGLKVYPQLATTNEPIYIETQQDGNAVVWNTIGQKIAQYPIFEHQINKIELKQSGFFLLELILNNATRQTFKIIVK